MTALRLDQARAIRETRALYAFETIRGWRNRSARLAARAVAFRAEQAAMPRVVTVRQALDVCGRHTRYEVCTCGT